MGGPTVREARHDDGDGVAAGGSRQRDTKVRSRSPGKMPETQIPSHVGLVASADMVHTCSVTTDDVGGDHGINDDAEEKVPRNAGESPIWAHAGGQDCSFSSHLRLVESVGMVSRTARDHKRG